MHPAQTSLSKDAHYVGYQSGWPRPSNPNQNSQPFFVIYGPQCWFSSSFVSSPLASFIASTRLCFLTVPLRNGKPTTWLTASANSAPSLDSNSGDQHRQWGNLLSYILEVLGHSSYLGCPSCSRLQLHSKHLARLMCVSSTESWSASCAPLHHPFRVIWAEPWAKHHSSMSLSSR